MNKSTRYAPVATIWEGDLAIVITPDGSMDQGVINYLYPWHGECRHASLVSDESQFSPVYRLESHNANWRVSITEELGPF